jgi:zinc protease
MAELELLKTEGPTAADIAKVQEAQRRQRELGLRQNTFWSGQLSQAYTYGDDPRDVLKYDEIMKSLTVDAIKAAAQKTFRMDNYVHVTLLPVTIIQ